MAREIVELTTHVVSRVDDLVTDPLGAATEQLSAARHCGPKRGRHVGGARHDGRHQPHRRGPQRRRPAGRAIESATGWLRSAMWPRIPGSGPLVDVFSAVPGDIDFARKLILGTRNDTALWTGTVGPDKAVAWSAPLPLADVKAVARVHEVTVNDVLVTCVAGTLHAYLERHGSRCASANFMIPVNLKPLDASLPEELGNNFALVQLELRPTGPTHSPCSTSCAGGWGASRAATRQPWRSSPKKSSLGSTRRCTGRRSTCSPAGPPAC